MNLPADVQIAFDSIVSEQGLPVTEIREIQPVSGGCINTCVRIETDHEPYFLKWNRKDAFPGMFEAEAKGLQLLQEAGALRVPKVIGRGSSGNTDILLLEWIGGESRRPEFFRDFGQALARQHQHRSEHFGLDHDNYIGSLPQSNTFNENWIPFFIEQRIQPQLKQARDGGYLGRSDIQSVERLFTKLDQIFPPAQPSLLHGDLWSGNFLVDQVGEPCIVDPAVYYGHPEMELAFTRLFGGYDRSFYEGYQSENPLEPGFGQRMDVYNLYPLLVHVNLFGQGYVGQVRQILRRF